MGGMTASLSPARDAGAFLRQITHIPLRGRNSANGRAGRPCGGAALRFRSPALPSCPVLPSLRPICWGPASPGSGVAQGIMTFAKVRGLDSNLTPAPGRPFPTSVFQQLPQGNPYLCPMALFAGRQSYFWSAAFTGPGEAGNAAQVRLLRLRPLIGVRRCPYSRLVRSPSPASAPRVCAICLRNRRRGENAPWPPITQSCIIVLVVDVVNRFSLLPMIAAR